MLPAQALALFTSWGGGGHRWGLQWREKARPSTSQECHRQTHTWVFFSNSQSCYFCHLYFAACIPHPFSHPVTLLSGPSVQQGLVCLLSLSSAFSPYTSQNSPSSYQGRDRFLQAQAQRGLLGRFWSR